MKGFSEVTVSQKMGWDIQVKRFLATVLPMMVALMIIMLNLPGIFTVVKFLASVGLFYLSYRMFLGFYIEWEYSFVTNEISFAKIMNKSRRKDLFTCQLKDTVVLTRNTDADHLSAVPKDIKTYRFLSGRKDTYYLWVTKDEKGRDICICFEPNREMLEAFRTLARSVSFIGEEDE